MFTPRLLFLFFIITTNVILSLQMSLSNSSHAVTQERLKVSLYYETYCGYCVLFIREQLYPGFQWTLGDNLIMDMVPYGNANTVGDKVTCQHGDGECYGNKLHACAIATLPQWQYMNFIACLVASDDPDNVKKGAACAEKNNLSWNALSTCASGARGNQLLIENGKRSKSLNPPLPYTPHIRFNDVYSTPNEHAARMDFVKTACSMFRQKPAACPH